MDIISLISIIVSLALLIFLVCKGVHVVIAAPLAAIIIVICSGLGYVEGYSTTYMTGLGSFVTKQLPVFLWGGVFGQIFNRSGCAASIARTLSRLLRGKHEHAGVFTTILIITVIGILLSYGGINSMVLMLLLMPMTLNLMKECGIPQYMAPGILLSSIATVGMCMPGSPQIVNVTPINFLGTTPMVGMIPGFIGALVVIVLNMTFLTHSANREIAKGNGFTLTEGKSKKDAQDSDTLPNPILSVLPLVIVFVLFNGFGLYVAYSIIIGTLFIIALNYKRLGGLSGILDTAKNAVVSTGILCLSGASLSGFAAVISATPTFKQLTESLASISGPPLFIAMIAIMLVVGICGAGPAGIGAALPMFTDTFAAMGINMSALHRVASFSATTLDTLPTNAGFIAATGLAQSPPGKSYKYVGVVTVVNTIIGTFVVTLLLTLFPGLA